MYFSFTDFVIDSSAVVSEDILLETVNVALVISRELTVSLHSLTPR